MDDTLLLIAPELASLDGAKRAGYISMASQRVSEKVFGLLYEQAVAYLAAHLATVGLRGGGQSTGLVKSLREGDLQITYSEAGTGYAATPYGEEYLRLCRSVTFSPMTRHG